MQALGCTKIQEYLTHLASKEPVRRKCDRIMGVSVSRFFRDKKLWELLTDEILPDLIESGNAPIKIWSAGCACGEEVYSLKMVWAMLEQKNIKLPSLYIIATDVNPLHLKKAKEAVYPLTSLREVPESLRTNFFLSQSGKKRYKVKSFLGKNIAWKPLSFFAGPPGSVFHLILIRNNLITYYKENAIKSVFDQCIEALSPGGYIVTGSHEKLPFEFSQLQSHPQLPYVYKKRRSSTN